VKKKTIIRVAVALILLGVAGRFGWVLLTTVRSTQTAQSPDQRYTAKVASKWFDDFWGRTSHETHCITVEDADGRSVRRIVAAEPWTGWPKDCSIQWATNSAAVTFTFKTEQSLKTHLIVDVTP
jgi:hypothetical protein